MRLRSQKAFTLLELLVVIVIIGILATIGLPAIKGMTKSNAMVSANRQLLDDLSYARQRAISDHTTVYVAFIPPYITDTTKFPLFPPTGANAAINNFITNLYTGQYTTYALISTHTVGDQPGVNTPRYLTDWRSLPNGIYIATNKFYSNSLGYAPPFATDVALPFPYLGTNSSAPEMVYLPYIAFNYLGQLVNNQQQLPNSLNYEFIPLARGSIFFDASGNADVLETPAGNAYYVNYNTPYAQTNAPLPNPESAVIYNQIHIDPLTGKARVERLDVQ